MPTDTPDKPDPVRLTVLPNSGKVDQLRAEVAATLPGEGAKSQAAAPAAPTTDVARKLLEGKVIAALKTVYDPEIPVDIYELGLIYNIEIDDEKHVHVQMTLTAPGCPVAGTLPGEVERRVETVPEVKSATVELVWEPAWSKDRMSEAAMLSLGM
ncbi:MAG TPA: SUF system Fe-S cluster assembly protein [Tepidisphaeraceae bacterium]|nr:SUF system Fe-S cluster assembly protein [Tepidisphaeraceae bacterium]